MIVTKKFHFCSPWPGDIEGMFRSSSQAATYGGGFTLPLLMLSV